MSCSLVIPTDQGDLVRSDKLLGKGAFSIVYEGEFRNEKVALKRIEIDRLPKKLMDEEETAMRQLNHPNVLKLFFVKDFTDFRYYILELCAATLSDYCSNDESKKYAGEMPSPIDCLLQMASGLEHIHAKKYVHRDIKPENVLISMGSPVCLKISDFGLSKAITASGSFTLSLPVKGSVYYMASELHGASQNIDANQRGNANSDVFSLGCVFFVYLTRGKHPFGKELKIVLNILENRCDLSEISTTSSASALIEHMIKRNPRERPDMKCVVETLSRMKSIGQM